MTSWLAKATSGASEPVYTTNLAFSSNTCNSVYLVTNKSYTYERSHHSVLSSTNGYDTFRGTLRPTSLRAVHGVSKPCVKITFYHNPLKKSTTLRHLSWCLWKSRSYQTCKYMYLAYTNANKCVLYVKAEYHEIVTQYRAC